MDGWVRAATLDDVRNTKLFSHLDKRIALYKTAEGVYATDNRCPHEGYALVRGEVKNGVLTCEWHNWKFALASGECTFGGENVRTYPVEIRGSDIWVDVTDPPPEKIAPQLFESLLDALGEVDIGRMARDTMRLQRIGVPLTDIVREGVRFGAPRVEYGWNHSLATLTDCLRLAEFFDGPLKALPVVQGLSSVSETEVRRPYRPRPEPMDVVGVYGSIDAALAAYPRLVDEEQMEEAESVLRGAIAAGATLARLRHALLVSVTDHFLGYGHAMIYVMKAFELLEDIGWDQADMVLGPLVNYTVLATRYDRLPYMARFLKTWRAAGIDLAALIARPQNAPFDEATFRRAVLDGSPEEAFAALIAALEGGAGVVRVLDATSRAAARRFGRFDIDLDIDDTNEWGWLDVTHTLTYIDALRWAWSVDPSPEVLRGLFHAVWFVQWTSRFDAKVRNQVAPFTTDDPQELIDAVRRHDPDAAVAISLGFNGPGAELDRALAQVASEDQHTAPIMVAHSVKTSRAAILESTSVGDRSAIAAATRFLASPKRERFVFNATLEAVAFMQGRSKSEAG